MDNVQFNGLILWYDTAIKNERMMAMYHIINTRGHIQVYDLNGKFLFSADSEREAREEMEIYAKSAA